MKLFTSLAATTLAAALLVVPGTASAAPADPAPSAPAAPSAAAVSTDAPLPVRAGRRTYCAKGSGTQSGTCWKLLRTRQKLNVVEAIPLENRTKRKRTNMHCSFTRSITRAVEVGGSATASAEFGVFKVVKANLSVTVHRKVTQTATEASTAGGSVTLRPGERVICQRTYGHVVARVKQYSWSGGRQVDHQILRSTIPANLGVRIVD